MKQSFFVQSCVIVDDNGLFVSIDLEKTNDAINRLLIHLHEEGFEVNMLTPVVAGVGQYQCDPGNSNHTSLLAKWLKPARQADGAGFGYSYTSGFLVLAHKEPIKP